jgi:ABC-type Fe3+ transport system permease subunit
MAFLPFSLAAHGLMTSMNQVSITVAFIQPDFETWTTVLLRELGSTQFACGVDFSDWKIQKLKHKTSTV